MCHNPNTVSDPDEGETVSVNMKEMIHKIHRGEALEFGFVTGGFGGDVDFSEIAFPGRLDQCSNCHGGNDISLPLPSEALPTVVGDMVTLPQAAACTACHDSLAAQIHGMLMGDPVSGAESCAVCHGPGMEHDAVGVHALGG